MFYNQQTLVSGFAPADVLYESLLGILGGRDTLELMINARGFRPMYAHHKGQGQGLVFHYNVSHDCDLRVAKFYPLKNSFTIYGQMYQVRLTVEKMLGDNTYNMKKPYYFGTAFTPAGLVRVFETVTGTALSFT